MSKKKISFGVLVGGLAIIVSGLSGIIIYPLLLKNCSKEIAGLWIFYNSFSIILSLGQAGLSPIIMRKAAEIKISSSKNDFINFLALISKSYKLITYVVVLISLIIYFSYIHWVLIKNPEIMFKGIFAWILFVCGNLINIYFGRNFTIINGYGEVAWDKMARIIISIFTISGYFITLSLGWDLIGLSVVFLLSNILSAYLSSYLLRKFAPFILTKGELGTASIQKEELIDLFKAGGQILILNLVGIVVMNKDIYLVERFLGLKILPLFSALISVQSIIFAVSFLIPQTIFPFISQNYAAKNYPKTKKLYLQGVFSTLLISISISLVCILSANFIIPIWLGKGNYLGNGVLGLLLLFGILNAHHNAHASAVISTGNSYFMWPAIWNAILAIPFAIIGIKYYGINGMIIGNLLATIIPSIYVVIYSIRFFNNLNKNTEFENVEKKTI
jgi:O-antigen/teichoic acid export membrane protein